MPSHKRIRWCFFSFSCFFFFYYFLNRRNNRRRPAADNSSGVIRRFPFRFRSLVSVCTFGINYHHTCWRKQTRFVILISILFFYYYYYYYFPRPVVRSSSFIFPKTTHRSPVSGTHAHLHCFRPHTTPAPPPIIARGAQRWPAQQLNSVIAAPSVRCCPLSLLWESKPCKHKQYSTIRGGTGPRRCGTQTEIFFY